MRRMMKTPRRALIGWRQPWLPLILGQILFLHVSTHTTRASPDAKMKNSLNELNAKNLQDRQRDESDTPTSFPVEQLLCLGWWKLPTTVSRVSSQGFLWKLLSLIEHYWVLVQLNLLRGHTEMMFSTVTVVLRVLNLDSSSCKSSPFATKLPWQEKNSEFRLFCDFHYADLATRERVTSQISCQGVSALSHFLCESQKPMRCCGGVICDLENK